MALLNTGRLDEALDALNKAVQIKPDYAQAHMNLGIAQMRGLRIKTLP